MNQIEKPICGPETDVVNANGKWTIQQWGAYSFRLTGDKDPNTLFAGGEATKPDGPQEKFRRIEGNVFVYSDFVGAASHHERYGNLTYAETVHDFAAKVIDGKCQCEIKFYISSEFRNDKVTANWGRRP